MRRLESRCSPRGARATGRPGWGVSPIGRTGGIRGVTLIEVLVALAACALFVTLLLPSVSTEVKRVQYSRLQAQAALVAARQIEQISLWPAIEPRPAEGVEGALRWAVRQVKVDAASGAGGTQASLRHFRVTVQLTDDPVPLVDMVVRRLGRADDAASTPSAGQR